MAGLSPKVLTNKRQSPVCPSGIEGRTACPYRIMFIISLYRSRHRSSTSSDERYQEHDYKDQK
jgi:hypothetical protein